MKKLLPRILLGVAAGVAIYLGFAIWKGWRDVAGALASFSWWAALGGLGLAAANYLVRFLRWQYYLRVLKVAVPAGESFLVFLGGFALTVTPGKLGEAVKAFLLRESRGIPAARTAPIVIAERLTDLVGLLLLAMVGVFSFDVDRRFLAVGAALIGVGLLAVSVESVAKLGIRVAGQVPGVRKFAHRLDTFHQSTKALLRPGPLLVAVALSVVSWTFECVAFWLVVGGFPGAQVKMQAAVFIYSAMTVVGALSFLPGGLGATEAGMLSLLGKLGTGTTAGVSLAAVFVTRLCTLWFAVAVGLGALVLFARRTHVSLQLPERSDAQAGSG
jgi:uncharacterized protein (TIRG00374 family)